MENVDLGLRPVHEQSDLGGARVCTGDRPVDVFHMDDVLRLDWVRMRPFVDDDSYAKGGQGHDSDSPATFDPHFSPHVLVRSRSQLLSERPPAVKPAFRQLRRDGRRGLMAA
jgi:hypothetical protein